MSEHDWPGDDHHQHDQPDDDLAAGEVLPQQDAWEVADDHWTSHDDDEPDVPDTHEVAHHDVDEPAHAVAEAGGRDSGPDLSEAPDEVFPPSVDVGPLPEPVDGWPWIDSSSLGLTGIETRPVAGLQPDELAAYAAQDLPPAADPWAALAESDDPATAALAEFYRPGGPGGDA